MRVLLGNLRRLDVVGVYVFEILDKNGRLTHLSNERWNHIRKKHPEIEYPELLLDTVRNYDKITQVHADQTIYYFWKYYKNKLNPNKFLLVVVKYLNGNGYVLSAYYEDKIK